MSDSLRLHGLCSPKNSPGQNIEVGSHSLLQGFFPTQGSNPGLRHWRQILYQQSQQGSPRILEWVTYTFLHWIVPTQELNWGLLHCRYILYQLSYQASPAIPMSGSKAKSYSLSGVALGAAYELGQQSSRCALHWRLGLQKRHTVGQRRRLPWPRETGGTPESESSSVVSDS